MNNLSVVIITREEENHIGKCLETVKWADEIIVVDSYSKDKTVEIAKKYTDKIYQVESIGTGKIKNMGIEKSKNKWILNLDADERVTEELGKEIENVLKNPEYDGYYIPRKSYIGKKWIKHAGQWPDYQLRLFRKDKGRFQPKMVHERVELNGKTGRLKNPILHYNFLGWEHYIWKMNWYTTKEAEGMMRKKFVWFYPWKNVKRFFREFRRQRKNGNGFVYSYVLSREAFIDYELKWTIPFKPIYVFFRFYIVQQGFRDGLYGFVWAVVCAFYRFMKYVKYREMKNEMERKIV